MAEFTVEFEKLWGVDGGICIHYAGLIDVTTDKRFRKTLQDVLEAGNTRVVLDMKDISFINSNGFASIVWFNDALDGIGSFVMLGLRKDIHMLATALGLDVFYENFPTLDEAIVGLGGNSEADVPAISDEAATLSDEAAALSDEAATLSDEAASVSDVAASISEEAARVAIRPPAVSDVTIPANRGSAGHADPFGQPPSDAATPTAAPARKSTAGGGGSAATSPKSSTKPKSPGEGDASAS